MPWKDPETAEEGAEEGECTACWVSEGTGPQGQKSGWKEALPVLPAAQSQGPVHILTHRRIYSPSIQGVFIEAPLRAGTVVSWYPQRIDSRTSSEETKLQCGFIPLYRM